MGILEDIAKSRENWAKDRSDNNTYNAKVRGKRVDNLDGYVCHRVFSGSQGGDPFEYALTHIKPVFDKKTITPFVDFWINDSVFADVYVDKDVDRVIAQGYVLRTDVSSTLFGAALIGSRMCYESYVPSVRDRLPVFNTLKSMGFTGSESFIGAHLYSKDSKGNYQPCLLHCGHNIFESGMYWNATVKAILDKKYNPSALNSKTAYENKGYSPGVSHVFRPDKDAPDPTAYTLVKRAVDNVVPTKYKDYKKLNIFLKMDFKKVFDEDTLRDVYTQVLEEIRHG